MSAGGGSEAAPPEISVIIPTRNGGELLGQVLDAIQRQRIDRPFEVLCLDCESSEPSVAIMKRFGVRIERIRQADFDHGLTRDLGAELSRGHVLVFLNGDARPCDERWLEELTRPLFDDQAIDAVQGGTRRLPPEECFYWDSSAARFYFTRESRRWLERHGGIGFSTVNAAIRRETWRRHPFGRAPFLEDKKWQGEVSRTGVQIVRRPKAAVFHSHNHDLRSIIRRCQSEGMGWRLIGERYRLRDALADLVGTYAYRQLVRGLRAGQIRSGAELFFPWIRPVMLYVGNRWIREVRL